MGLVASVPLAHSDSATRVGYLQRVAGLTAVGLVLAAITGFASATAIAVLPVLQGRWTSLIVMFGAYAVAQFVAPPFVFSRNAASQWFGFLLGATFQGVAMGYLLLTAVLVSSASLGSPLALIGQALGLTVLASGGMTAYLWSSPRELSWIKAGLAALFLPMIALMVITLIWPVNGVLGILMSAVFVVISVGGLLYQMNEVIHKLRSDEYVPGAYMVTMGILILFWNVLVLLMRLNRR